MRNGADGVGIPVPAGTLDEVPMTPLDVSLVGGVDGLGIAVEFW